MNKRYLHHWWRRFHAVRPWYFLILALIFGFISVLALRNNNLTMIKIRDQVYQADKDNGDVEGALRTLRSYVYGHMNTNLSSGNNAIYPPIQLKYSYDRALTAAAGTTDPNTKIYTDAQTECEKQFPHGLSGSGRIPCIQEYIANHGVQTAQVPNAALYQFDFTSPRWSPDLAGWSLVATVVFLILFIVRWLTEKWLQFELKD